MTDDTDFQTNELRRNPLTGEPFHNGQTLEDGSTFDIDNVPTDNSQMSIAGQALGEPNGAPKD